MCSLQSFVNQISKESILNLRSNDDFKLLPITLSLVMKIVWERQLYNPFLSKTWAVIVEKVSCVVCSQLCTSLVWAASLWNLQALKSHPRIFKYSAVFFAENATSKREYVLLNSSRNHLLCSFIASAAHIGRGKAGWRRYWHCRSCKDCALKFELTWALFDPHD